MNWFKNWFKKKDTTRVEDKKALPKSLFDKGMDFYEHGDFQAAHDAFENSIAEYQALIAVGHDDLRPDLAKSYKMFGNCLVSLGDNQAALAAYETGISECKQLIAEGHTELRPELTKTQMNCGNCFGNLGDFPKARTIYETSITDYKKLIVAGHTELRPFLVIAQMNLGFCLSSLEEFSTARKIYEACIIDYEKLISEGHNELKRRLAQTQVSLGECLVKLKDFSAAQKNYESGIANYENLVAKDHKELLPELAGAYSLLGIFLSEIPNLSEACTAYENGIAGYEKLVAEGHNELIIKLASAQSFLGECLATLGKLPRACKIYENCITNYEYLIDIKHDDLRSDLIKMRMNLANCLKMLGKLALARTNYETILNEYEGWIDQGRTELLPYLAITRTNLADCLVNLGELPLARTAYETTLNDYESLIYQGRSKWQSDLALTRRGLADCLYSLGELSLAKTAYETALDEYENLIEQGRVELQPELARTRVNLANCFDNFGKLALTRTTYDTALKEFENLIDQGRVELQPELAITRMNLAICLNNRGELALAQTTYEMSLKEFENLIDQGRVELQPDLARTRMCLATCLDDLGELALAKTTYETSLNEYKSLIDQGRVELRHDIARTHRNLANTFKTLGNLANAEKHYHASLTLLQTLQLAGQIVPDTFNFMRDITNWYRHPQRPKGVDKTRAFELAQQSLDWLDTLLTRISDTAKNVHIEKNLASFHLATELALELNQPEQAYLILERSKSRVLVEQMLRERTEPGSHVDENLRAQYRELRAKLRSFVNQLGASTPTGMAGDSTTRFFTPTTRSIERSPEQTEQLWQQQQAVEQELDKVRRAITEQDAAFGEAIQPRALTVEEVIALIPADTLVIAFEQGPDFLRLYAITAQGIPTPLQIDLSSQQINERAVTFQNDMREYTIAKNVVRLRKTVDKLCKWLTAQLKEPLTKLTAQFQPQHIILIPHVAWHLLPIHLVTIDNEPLAVRYPLHYLPSIQILRLIRERLSAKQEKGCIVANPTQDLAGAEQESQTVYNLRGQTDKLLSRQDANLSAVRNVLDNTQHSHFSCHGCFDQDLTKAGLLLADGLLAAKEMFTSIRMDNPRLVVMSACETAQIKPTLADEYMGLSSSFLFAGAHNVLATLWPVEDNASRLLIEEFYQGLNDGLSTVKALQQAQYQLRNMTKETVKAYFPDMTTGRPYPYNNPYYWAGFVLIGDGE